MIRRRIQNILWKEWELFRLPGGINMFLILHFPMLVVILYGLVLVYAQSYFGLLVSFVLSLGGIFAFSIHMYFIKKGKPEFKSSMSVFILIALFVTSVCQFSFCIYLSTIY